MGRDLLRRIAGALALIPLAAAVASFWAAGASAASSFELESVGDKHHVTADRTLYHSREGVYEAFGHVVVSSRGQRMSADYLWVDEKTKEMKARGNVVFVDKETIVHAAEIHFNFASGIGSIFYGRVTNDQYTLRGQLIRRVSGERYLTTEGEYTTCKDCAESWKLSARSVDLTVEGYAFMESVFVKIKDVPTLFLPYLVVPVKTKRQSGLLFPRFGGGSNNGGVFVQPLFLAISDQQDLTLSFGKYTAKGHRYEGEYRFNFGGGHLGQFTFFHTRDRKFRDQMTLLGIPSNGGRTAIIAKHELPIHQRLDLRWRVNEVFDRDYSFDYAEDIDVRHQPALESNAVLSSHWDSFFVSAEARRYRNLIYDRPIGFDGGTVQTLPTVHFGVKPISVAGPLLASFYGRFDRFRRHNGSFQDRNADRFYDPASDYIREADRWILQPEISAPFRLGNVILLTPSAQFNEIGYSFDVPRANGQHVPATDTRYAQLKLDVSTVLERVYDYDGESVSKVKHQLIPFVSGSNIPWIQQGKPGHPFNADRGQLENPAGLFDQYDLVPFTNDTNFLRYPQGKSVYYGFTSRLVRKMRGPEEAAPRPYPFDEQAPATRTYPKPLNRKMELANERQKRWDDFGPQYDRYQEIWTVNVSQAFDFKSAARFNDDKKRAFSYLLAKSDLAIDNFSHTLEYRFFPRIDRSRSYDSSGALVVPPLGTPIPEPWRNKQFISTSFTWFLKRSENLRRTRSFVRSVSAGFTNSSVPNRSRTARAELNWSLNDFVNTNVIYQYDLLAKSQMDWGARLTLTHPSECWGIRLNYDWQTNRRQKADYGFKLLLNLMGTGFLDGDQLQGGPGGVFGG